METIPMATNKKKPNNLMRIWFSLMKAAFYSFLISERLGRPKGKRRCIITPMSEARFQQSEQFQFLQSGGIWHFISSSIKETSMAWILKIFSATYSSTYAETSFYYGMVLRYTGVLCLKNIYNSIQGCRLKSSPAMRQSLILLNTFGIKLTRNYPTHRLKICNSLKPYFQVLPIGFLTLSSFYGPAFMLLTCHGSESRSCTYYFCKAQ